MDRYRILESARHGIERVRNYDDLEIHHPSRNVDGLRTGKLTDFEPGRSHARIEGQFEETRRTSDGRTLVKKDFILLDDAAGQAHLPAPVAGFVHYRKDKTATVQIFDRPQGERGARLLAQVMHMDPRTFRLPEGARVAYGQPLGVMSDTGSPGAIHAHVEAEPAQFRRYIRDIDNGTIAPGRWPSRGRGAPDDVRAERTGSIEHERARSTSAPRARERVLEDGDRGIDVRALQQALNRLGIRDASGSPLVDDGNFGRRTREAVESFQREHGLACDGRVGEDTREALAGPHGQRITDHRHPYYPLFEQVLGRLHDAESARGLASGAHSLNVAAALVVQMRHDGIGRADRIEFNDSSKLARVVQASPSGLREHELSTMPIDTAQAASRSIHHSSDQLARMVRDPAPPREQALQPGPAKEAALVR